MAVGFGDRHARRDELLARYQAIHNMTSNRTGHAHHHLTHEEEEKHAGLVFLSFAVLVTCQASLYLWKNKYPRSYQRVTSALLWLFPPAMSVYLHFWRFVLVWAVYTIFTGRRVLLASKKPVAVNVPRDTYTYFYKMYQVTIVSGIIGYFSFIFHTILTSAGYNVGPYLVPLGVLALFYGVYFGVLNRDVASVVGERLNATMGFSAKTGLPKRNLEVDICALCGNVLKQGKDRAPPTLPPAQTLPPQFNGAPAAYPGLPPDESPIDCTPPTFWEMVSPIPDKDATVQLSCQHRFHELCVRGWVVVGKKDVCPYCSERVDLKTMFVNPWETHSKFWSSMLDVFRYLVVWNPLIFTGVNLFLKWTGITHAHEALHHA